MHLRAEWRVAARPAARFLGLYPTLRLSSMLVMPS